MLIGGSQKMLTYDDMEPSEKVRVYDKGVDFDPSDDERRRQMLVSYRTGDVHAPNLDRREALQRPDPRIRRRDRRQARSR